MSDNDASRRSPARRQHAVDVGVLALEQEDQTAARARTSPNGTAMTYVAAENALALLVCRVHEKPARRLYVCKIQKIEDRNDEK